MKITVKRELCVGAGQCVMAAEKVFDQDDEGIVVLLVDNPPLGLESAAQTAATLCPARAIEITE